MNLGIWHLFYVGNTDGRVPRCINVSVVVEAWFSYLSHFKNKFRRPISQEHQYDISIKGERMKIFSGLFYGLEPIRVKEINLRSLKK
jgi:hypothetical protein